MVPDSWSVIKSDRFARLWLTSSTSIFLFNPTTPWRILLLFLPFQMQELKLRVVMSFVPGSVAAEWCRGIWTQVCLLPNDWHAYLAPLYVIHSSIFWPILLTLVFLKTFVNFFFYLTGLSSSPATPSQEVTIILNLKWPLVNFSFGFLHINIFLNNIFLYITV